MLLFFFFEEVFLYVFVDFCCQYEEGFHKIAVLH